MPRKNSILDILMIDASGGEISDEDFNNLYRENREIIALIESREKKEFTLRKDGKSDRTVKARCIAEIEGNPANKGWTIIPPTDYDASFDQLAEITPGDVSYYQDMSEIHDMRA